MDNQLDSFEVNLGLPCNILIDNEQYKDYLQMDISQLEKLSYRECANISYKLNQFALYIQRCLNKENAKVRMLNQRIKSIIAPRVSQFSGAWKYQEEQAIQENDATRQMNEELLQCETKKDRLEFVASGIKNLAESMKNIQFAKAKNYE